MGTNFTVVSENEKRNEAKVCGRVTLEHTIGECAVRARVQIDGLAIQGARTKELLLDLRNRETVFLSATESTLLEQARLALRKARLDKNIAKREASVTMEKLMDRIAARIESIKDHRLNKKL